MRWRLLAAFCGVMVVMLAAQDLPLVSHLRRVEVDRQLAELERDAFILAGQAASALSPPAADTQDPDADLALADTVADYSERQGPGVVVTNAGGSVVATTGVPGIAVGDDLATRPEVATALRSGPATGREGDIVSIAVPVLVGADTVGTVMVSTDDSEIDARAARRTRGVIAVAGISLLAAAVAALFMASSVTGPLRKLRHSTERVAGGDFTERADDTQGAPELRALASSFNTMTGRLAGLVDQQRRFAGDASHQLRTPLTALRLQLERATALVDQNPAEAAQILGDADREIDRLQRLIGGLLTLARTDAAVPTPRALIDVSAVVAERAAMWAPLAEEQGVGIEVVDRGGATAVAVPGALDQVLDNYLDNAIAVAPESSTVEVVVDGSTAAVIRVHVLDRGPGLPDDQLAHAFDRFWRSPDASHDGSGIGLAIVAHLATSSGGTANLHRRPGGGLDASVTLPRS
ncbi:MAG TPA: HAMP domain-containing sensor histidine kinase [Desertimonas sp.]|nr:HAMP domain-containing sensor histidine kinase [Desertimonas sp.]